MKEAEGNGLSNGGLKSMRVVMPQATLRSHCCAQSGRIEVGKNSVSIVETWRIEHFTIRRRISLDSLEKGAPLVFNKSAFR